MWQRNEYAFKYVFHFIVYYEISRKALTIGQISFDQVLGKKGRMKEMSMKVELL